MIEKYFKIENEHALYKEFFQYQENGIKINGIVKDFFKKWQIEAKEYRPLPETIMIVPTATDLKKFANILCKPSKNNACKFKKTSKVANDWAKTLDTVGAKIIHYPWMFQYFEGCGKTSSSMFINNQTLYLKYTNEYETKTPDGMNEIKPSEYYFALETLEKEEQQ